MGERGSRDGDKTLLAKSLVVRNPKDTPNRRVARIVALEQALGLTDLSPEVQSTLRSKIAGWHRYEEATKSPWKVVTA